MATAVPPAAETKEDNYELELSRVREKIKIKIAELLLHLKARESELLSELDHILSSYHTYRNKVNELDKEKVALKKTKSLLEAELPASPIKSVHEGFIFQLDTKIDAIDYPVQPKIYSFEFDNNKLLTEVNKLGVFVSKVLDYESKVQPQVSVCERGERQEQLDLSHGLTVDKKTGNVYIADQRHHCVKVFDSNGVYLFKFGDREGEGKMLCPNGVAIHGNIIRTTHFNHCIMSYSLLGKFVSSVGRKGKRQLEFDIPFGLTIDASSGDIYICDLDNNRVQILKEDSSFKAQFGKDTLKHPRDIKLSKEYIYVLDESNPCLHLFNYNHIKQKSVISRGEGMQSIFPFFFFLDQTNNIIISDRDSNCITIFTPRFQLLHKIGVSNSPMGVAVDSTGRVVVVCQSDNNCLQMY